MSLCLLVVISACSGDEGYCVEARITIAQGLYGRVTYQSDVGPGRRVPVGDEQVNVLDAPMGTVVASTSSSSDGVFQVALDVGSYVVCYPPLSPPPECVSFTIASGKRVREDLYKGFGTAWVAESPSDCAE